MDSDSCFLCRKHAGKEESPPGGYLYEDEHWIVCHAPARLSPLGTLFIESRRHFLDHSDMLPEEALSLGGVMQRVYAALKMLTQAERIYLHSTMEGQPHLHMWLIPRRREDTERGLKFLARDDSCTQAEAEALSAQLKDLLAQP
ncbi:MAG TPA: HIT family protein [Anaerolineales bacterium]